MQKHVNLVDLVKSFPTNIYLQNLASIQKRTSPVKFAHLAEKSGKGSISNLSTKAGWGSATLAALAVAGAALGAATARRPVAAAWLGSVIISGSNENSPKASRSVCVLAAMISGPNENSPKESISVCVLAADSEDGICVNEHQRGQRGAWRNSNTNLKNAAGKRRIRTGSQMENKLLENCFQRGRPA